MSTAGATSLERLLKHAVDCHRQGRLAQAEAAYRELLGLDPHHPDALHLLGVALAQSGRAAEAADHMQRSLAARPAQAVVEANLASALSVLGRYDEALAACERSIGSMPDNASAHHGRGNILSKLGRWDAAAASYRRALELAPGLVEAHHNLALVLLQLGRSEEALLCYDRVLKLAPHVLGAWIGRGRILLDRGRNAQAVTAFEAALRLKSDDPTALFLCGRALAQCARPAQAAGCFRRLQEIDRNFEYVLGARLWAELHACLWSGHAALIQEIEAAVSAGLPACFPFVFFSVCDSQELQLQCARQFALRYRPEVKPLWTGEVYRHDRIRVAYVSEDFRSHPTSYLMMELWELHDRRRFEIIAISLRPEEDSEVGRRVKSAFDRFIDVSMLPDAEIAQRMRELEIDIAVDLMGHTGGGLHSILARRPAPVQVNYLGYPGTLGTSDADYLIADAFLIPEAHKPFFAEKIVHIPGTYQPNDRRRATCLDAPSRARAGLPQDAFVWCSFNNPYKLNPRLFDIWCRLLEAVPGSVLWLAAGATETEANLRRELAARRIDPTRLIFAPSAHNPEHVARIALADLCLDTAPVNGATTTSDALWAGVPVLTCAGRSFVSRMAGSLLTGAGLPELITSTWREYEELALALARDPQRLALLRAKLAGLRGTCALFDTDRTRGNLEAAYSTMWERQRRGEPPSSFTVGLPAAP